MGGAVETVGAPDEQYPDCADEQAGSGVAGEMIGRPDKLVALVSALVPGVSLCPDTRKDAGQNAEPMTE